MVLVLSYTAQQPVDDFGLNFAPLKYSASLAATTDTTFTVPGSYPFFDAIIKVAATDVELADGVWVALNGTAAVPAGASFAASTSELVTSAKSLCRRVKAGDVLHFITASAATSVSIILYPALSL